MFQNPVTFGDFTRSFALEKVFPFGNTHEIHYKVPKIIQGDTSYSDTNKQISQVHNAFPHDLFTEIISIK